MDVLRFLPVSRVDSSARLFLFSRVLKQVWLREYAVLLKTLLRNAAHAADGG